MREPGPRAGEGPADEQATDPHGSRRVPPEAVKRADLLRSRHAVFGAEVHPETAMFASQLARAVADAPSPAPRRAVGTRRGDAYLENCRGDASLVDDDVHVGRPGDGVLGDGACGDDGHGDDGCSNGVLRDAPAQEHPAPASTEPGAKPVFAARRDPVFGETLGPDVPAEGGTRGEPVRRGPRAAVPSLPAAGRPDTLRLPTAPAVVCDRSGRIVRANADVARLVGRSRVGDGRVGESRVGDSRVGDDSGAEADLLGKRLAQLVGGPDTDARLVRADGSLVRVRVVRWELPGTELSAAVFVELGDAGGTAVGRTADPAWTAELERLCRVGTWSFELATGTLYRGETLEELYRSVGLDPRAAGARSVESEQVALLCQGLRAGVRSGDHHVELRLPGEVLLSCRAEVECAADGTPARLVGVVRDLSAQRLAQRRARHCGQRFVDLMAVVPGGVALLDSNGRVVDANLGLCMLLGASSERLRGVAAAQLAAPRPEGNGRPDWLRPVPPGARYGYRVDAAPLRRADGSIVWCELAVAVTSADDGGWFWLVAAADISERRRATELLRSAATVDDLTRLPNRAAVLELADRLLWAPGRDRVAVVCGDLDDFRRVNSSLGHEAGDELLVTLAGRLQRDLPVGCTAARLSGDEFAVVCADHADVGGPDRLARTVADLLRTTVTVRGMPVQVTASVGVATPPPVGQVRGADLLRFAEVAMHEVKRAEGRGGVGVATDGAVSSAARELELEAELRDAIAGAGLVLNYQPVVAPDGTVLSAEALIRWVHPERGLLSPADFLPVARRSGLLRDLDLWVLRTAVREAVAWPAHQGLRPSVAVNLAGLLPGDRYFLAAVTEIVTDAGLPWDRLVLELVETSLVELPQHALAAMAELVERGVRFAVDDFGTGHSSLARLKELPAQTVKVDRAFVTGIADDPADFAVARAVVEMARAMGRTTVAEGVETAAQFHALRGIGVDAYQGWLFARPLPASALREMLSNGRLDVPA